MHFSQNNLAHQRHNGDFDEKAVHDSLQNEVDADLRARLAAEDAYKGGVASIMELLEQNRQLLASRDRLANPEAILGMSVEDLQHLGRQYLERLWRDAPEATHISDKMPVNFFYVGRIPLMLPQAKIIHAMRDPIDSCFCCHSRLFGEKTWASSTILLAWAIITRATSS